MARPYSLIFVIIATLTCSSSINNNPVTVGAADEEDINSLNRVCYGNSTNENNVTNLNFQNNVHLLLSILESESTSLHPPLTFFNTSVGRVTHRAYGYFLCRGDLSVRQCHNCLVNLTRYMSNLDIDSSECIGFGGLTRCRVHYADSSKVSVYEEGLVLAYQPIGKNVTNYQNYNETLSNTLQDLIIEAGNGNWPKTNFATRVVDVTGSHEKIYILVQCTPDISVIHCSKCLGELYSYVPDCCTGSQGGVLVHANCLIKYNNQTFFGRGSPIFVPSYIRVTFLLLFTMYITFM